MSASKLRVSSWWGTDCRWRSASASCPTSRSTIRLVKGQEGFLVACVLPSFQPLTCFGFEEPSAPYAGSRSGPLQDLPLAGFPGLAAFLPAYGPTLMSLAACQLQVVL